MKIIIILSFLACSLLSADVVRRAALDVGSGEAKLMVADVDSETQQIIRIYYQDLRKVELRKDLTMSADGTLSERVQCELIDAIKEMQQAAAAFAPMESSGVATSVFRKAKNGQEVADRIKAETNVRMEVVPQTEEGKIGFHSGVASSKLDANAVSVWDSGSGSFQISTLKNGQIEMYGAEFAFVSTLETLFELRGKPYSKETPINPITLQEATQLVKAIQRKIPAAPAWVAEKHLLGIGANTCIFSIGSIASGELTYTKEQVWSAIESGCGKTDEHFTQFKRPEEAVAGLILLYSIMDHVGIDRVTFCLTNGGCEGILVMPNYWASTLS